VTDWNFASWYARLCRSAGIYRDVCPSYRKSPSFVCYRPFRRLTDARDTIRALLTWLSEHPFGKVRGRTVITYPGRLPMGINQQVFASKSERENFYKLRDCSKSPLSGSSLRWTIGELRLVVRGL
jgi:hypothetical protein